ncbi:MAG: DNA circularization N-terminal domain-containing protein [Burkholderiales bacterium]|nr:DNA circularization N-terminal domain-containing protein [Burkholderiales bacterium]
MTVRVGKIELTGVQSLHTEEARTLVEQRVPEQQGSTFQDLGRDPVTIVLEGLLLGEEVQSNLETLRAAQAKAEALSFAADIAVGTELTEVVIEDFRVRQVAGYRNRYRFTMRLREHVEPPQPAAAATAPVDASVAADADAWSEGTVGAAAVLQDPASLSDALAEKPELLEHLDMDDLGAAVANNMDSLSGANLGGMLGTLGELDPDKASGFMGSLSKAGALGQVLNKCLQEGPALLEKLKKLDMSKLGSLFQALTGGLEFLGQLKKVADAASKIAGDVKDLKVPPELARILKR